MTDLCGTLDNPMPAGPLPGLVARQLAEIPNNVALAIRIVKESLGEPEYQPWIVWATRELTRGVAPKAVDHANT